jgi:hypothetical protein
MRRLVPPVILGLFVLSGCGSETLLSQVVLDQARFYGVAPDLIYAVELEGYELVEQSVGGIGESMVRICGNSSGGASSCG